MIVTLGLYVHIIIYERCTKTTSDAGKIRTNLRRINFGKKEIEEFGCTLDDQKKKFMNDVRVVSIYFDLYEGAVLLMHALCVCVCVCGAVHSCWRRVCSRYPLLTKSILPKLYARVSQLVHVQEIANSSVPTNTGTRKTK